jgi:hypothetical protein
MDHLQRAEEFAKKLAHTKSRFVYLTPADRAVAMVLWDEVRTTQRDVADLQRRLTELEKRGRL